MAKVTVKQLAETVKVPVDRLLKQMQEAGQLETYYTCFEKIHAAPAEHPQSRRCPDPASRSTAFA